MKHIILVEDHDRIAQIYQELIGPNYQITRVRTGDEALNIDADYILSDFYLSGPLDGAQLAREMHRRGLPLENIVLTSVDPSVAPDGSYQIEEGKHVRFFEKRYAAKVIPELYNQKKTP